MKKPSLKPIIHEIKKSKSPVDIFRALKDLPYSFFLDSSASDEKLGRYSFIGCEPFLVFKSKGGSITLDWQNGKKENFCTNPFTALKTLFDKYHVHGNSPIPFTSGGVGYFSYDLKHFTEKLPDISKDDLGLPDCIMAFYDAVIIYDNLKKKTYIASSGLPETEFDKMLYRRGRRIDHFLHKLSQNSPAQTRSSASDSPALKSNFTKDSYIKAIERAKEYIRRGDIYQVNLSQRFEARIDENPFDIYERLRKISPAPFAAYLDFDDVVILSSSPERFLLKREGRIETRPIKGTRPRGKNPFADYELAKELLASPKDRAEHIMIVDLERNDLGRISEYGSVKVEESVILEKYSTVFHLVSTVAGKPRKDVDPVDALLATFPGGSITGAPKIRSMEIIEELEPVKRSVYTGAIGYISFDGNMDTSIVIRTFLVKGDKIYFQVGGGIVADSDPKKEYEETIDKARGLMSSLGIAEHVKEFI
jgi:para-aminobenzoate synthetase component I